MKFKDNSVPDVTVISNGEFQFEIKTMQELVEGEDRVILKCAEHIDDFKRGYTCDLVCNYEIVDRNRENKELRVEDIRDLVLVYVNKYWSIERFTEYEYVFYK